MKQVELKLLTATAFAHARVPRPAATWFHENYIQTLVLQPAGDEAISPSNIEDGARRWKLPQGFHDTCVAVSEPK